MEPRRRREGARPWLRLAFGQISFSFFLPFSLYFFSFSFSFSFLYVFSAKDLGSNERSCDCYGGSSRQGGFGVAFDSGLPASRRSIIPRTWNKPLLLAPTDGGYCVRVYGGDDDEEEEDDDDDDADKL